MSEARLTRDGKIALPPELLRELGLVPGDCITLTPLDGRSVLLRAKTRSILDLASLLRTDRQDTGGAPPVEILGFD